MVNQESSKEQLLDRIKELEQQLQFYKELVDEVPIAIFAKDMTNEGRYKVWNKKMAEFIGVDTESVIGLTDREFIKQDELYKHYQNRERSVFENREKLEISESKVETKFGTKIFHTKLVPFFDEFGSPKTFLGCLEDVSESIAQRRALLASQNKYKQLFDNLRSAFALHQIVCDENNNPIDYIFLEANQVFLQRLNMKECDVLNKRALELFPETEQYWVETFGKVALTGEPLVFENYSKELNKYYESYIFSPEKGQFATFFTDISLHKEAENKMREAKELYSDLVETAQDLIWKCDNEGRYVFLNNATEDIYGYKPEEMIGLKFYDFISPESLETDLALFQEMLANNKIVINHETCHIKKGGIPVYLNFNARTFHDAEGNVLGTQGTAQDRTLRRLAENELRASEEQFRKLLKMLPVGVAIHCCGVIVYANDRAANIMDISSKDQFIGKQVLDFVHPDYREVAVQRIMSSYSLREELPIYFEKFISATGRLVDVEVSTIPTRFDQKPAILVVFQDISERIKQEELLRENEMALLRHNEELTALNDELSISKAKMEESDRLKSAFLANMSHEIRTPMNGIVGFADMMNKENISNEKKMYYAEIIKKSAFQLLNIVNDILDISKIETGQVDINLYPVNINDVLIDLFNFYEPMADQENVKLFLNISLDEIKATVYTDDVKLKQILNNLISNAVKFTHQGYIKIAYACDHGFIRFVVQDTGIGIPKDQQALIFDRFRKARNGGNPDYGGTGLGLAIAKAYVEKLGGTIHLDSEPGFGTEFSFTIPYIQHEETQAPVNNFI